MKFIKIFIPVFIQCSIFLVFPLMAAADSSRFRLTYGVTNHLQIKMDKDLNKPNEGIKFNYLLEPGRQDTLKLSWLRPLDEYMSTTSIIVSSASLREENSKNIIDAHSLVLALGGDKQFFADITLLPIYIGSNVGIGAINFEENNSMNGQTEGLYMIDLYVGTRYQNIGFNLNFHYSRWGNLFDIVGRTRSISGEFFVEL